jgi:TIR domain
VLPVVDLTGEHHLRGLDSSAVGPEQKHVFVSYVREDSDKVDRLCRALEAAHIPYWRDRTSLGPGDAWKAKIRNAIRDGSMVFLACFSEQYWAKDKSYMNEELRLAVEEVRARPPGRKYLIPVRFDTGDVPEFNLGGGETLHDLNYADLFGDGYTEAAIQLIDVIKQAMGTPGLDPAIVRTAVGEAADADRPVLLRRLTEDMIHDPAQAIQLDALIAQEMTGILAAMRDQERFPNTLANGTNEEQILQAVTAADDYWSLVEPFCWSLQVAARWAPDTASLRPWVNGLRSFCTEAAVVTGGHQILFELRYIPALTAAFVAAFASGGQGRWDNFKTLLVDTTVPSPRYQKQKISVVEAVDPFKPFAVSDWVPNVLARAVIEHEGFDVALSALTGDQPQAKYQRPTAEWLHHIIRPAFDTQFPDDGDYDRGFDRAEVMLGIVGQDQAIVHAERSPDLGYLFRSRWFGRSTWRAYHGHGNPVEDIAEELASKGAAWEPVAAGLFGGSPERASESVSKYGEVFVDISSKSW